MNAIAIAIYKKVLEAMQDAEELGGPEGSDYVELMEKISTEAGRRAQLQKTFQASVK